MGLVAGACPQAHHQAMPACTQTPSRSNLFHRRQLTVVQQVAVPAQHREQHQRRFKSSVTANSLLHPAERCLGLQMGCTPHPTQPCRCTSCGSHDTIA